MQKIPHGDQSGPRPILVKKSKFAHFLTQLPDDRSYLTDINKVLVRRSGLKIRRSQGRGGSTPPPGTNLNP
jgi:hypothetical protein